MLETGSFATQIQKIQCSALINKQFRGRRKTSTENEITNYHDWNIEDYGNINMEILTHSKSQEIPSVVYP